MGIIGNAVVGLALDPAGFILCGELDLERIWVGCSGGGRGEAVGASVEGEEHDE